MATASSTPPSRVTRRTNLIVRLPGSAVTPAAVSSLFVMNPRADERSMPSTSSSRSCSRRARRPVRRESSTSASATSKPLMSGSNTSSSTTSGRRRVRQRERPLAVSASPTTSKPPASSSFVARRRKLGWSSTIRTRAHSLMVSQSILNRLMGFPDLLRARGKARRRSDARVVASPAMTLPQIHHRSLDRSPCVPRGAGCTGDDAPKLHQLVRGLVADGAPGSLAVVRTPTRVVRASSGFSDRELRARMRPTDRFRIASVTKTFVATVVASARRGGATTT